MLSQEISQQRQSDGWTAQPDKPQPAKKSKLLSLKAVNITSKLDRRKASPSTFSKYKVISKGLAIGWRMNRSGTGTWTARRMGANGKYDPLHVIGTSDEATTNDGASVYSYDQAVAAAIAWAEDAKELHQHGVPTNACYTVKDCVLDYLTANEAEKRKELDRDRSTANAHIIPAIGDIELKELTHSRLKTWRDGLAKAQPRRGHKKGGATPLAATGVDSEDAAERLRKRQSSANRILTVLKAALNWSLQERRQYIKSDNAWKHVKPFKGVDVAKIRFLSDDELKVFIPAIAEEAFRKLVKGALFTGTRLGELVRLQVKNFNPADGTVFIDKSKNGEARHVFLNAEAVAWFASIVEGKAPSDKVFVKADGSAWKQSEQFRPMKAACAAANVVGVSFHILRHTYASHALMAKMPLEVLQKQLGHKSITITIKHYGHLSEAYRQAQVQQFAPSYNFDAVAVTER